MHRLCFALLLCYAFIYATSVRYLAFGRTAALHQRHKIRQQVRQTHVCHNRQDDSSFVSSLMFMVLQTYCLATVENMLQVPPHITGPEPAHLY